MAQHGREQDQPQRQRDREQRYASPAPAEHRQASPEHRGPRYAGERAAHSSERTAAPVAAWLAGVCGRPLDEANEIAVRLGASEPGPAG
jgi:hypothetical protein